jgi:aminocarboxymuconate-semialdehyde decarboxylase
MIIDAHGHFVPLSLQDAIRSKAASFPSVKIIEEAGSIGFSFMGNKPTRPISKGLSDTGARAKWMDEQGIDKQVCGGWLDMFGNDLPPDEGERWARLMNEHLLSGAKESGRIIPLCSVPFQDGERAAAVLRDAHAAGFKGAMIGTQPKGVGGVMDDPSLDPFWKAADELGSVLFIHPVFESGDNRVHDYGMANGVGRITDTLIAVSRIIYSGHVQKYSRAKIVAGIGGAAIPYIVGRLRRNWSLDKKLGNPDEALKLFYYDTLIHDARALKYLIEIVGTERLMMGSDMPFPIGDTEPMKIVADAGLTGEKAAWVNGGLAKSIFVD